jgi:hypothetical protein
MVLTFAIEPRDLTLLNVFRWLLILNYLQRCKHCFSVCAPNHSVDLKSAQARNQAKLLARYLQTRPSPFNIDIALDNFYTSRSFSLPVFLLFGLSCLVFCVSHFCLPMQKVAGSLPYEVIVFFSLDLIILTAPWTCR